MNTSTTVLVIGGGPAGSTVATLIAREGYDVTLIERATFPRYHIGESLLPACLPVLDLMGAREKVEQYGFQRKEGAYFAWGIDQWDYNFGVLSGDYAYSYQVTRADFDHLLLKHAKSQSVQVYEGVEIRDILFDGDRPRGAVWAKLDDSGQTGEIAFDYVVDASGRAGILATRYLRSRQHHAIFQNVAIWGYWKGARTVEGEPFGAIKVGSIPDGWLWGIPLHTGKMSVGLVIHKSALKAQKEAGASIQQIYTDGIRQSELLSDLLQNAELDSQVQLETDYSYTSERFAGPGYFISGDAACFLDPLLSTGMHLAMYSGMLASASLLSLLRGEISEDVATTFYQDSYRQTYLRFLVMVSAFYQQYRGKNSYFWEAQKLTGPDLSTPELREAFADKELLKQALTSKEVGNNAFVSIVSGLEDMRSVDQNLDLSVMEEMLKLQEETWGLLKDKEALAKLTESEREEARAKMLYYNELGRRFSLTRNTAVDEYYVVTKPRLGLALVRQPQSMP